MLPKPAIERLARLYRLLEIMEEEQIEIISSRELAVLFQEKAHTIRKDLSFLGRYIGTAEGYRVSQLKAQIGVRLGYVERKRTCIVGLGRMGTAVLNHLTEQQGNIYLAAGFDSSINRLELLKTDIPLFPAYTIPEKAAALHIELAVVTVPSESARKTAERLAEGGIRGILNFTPVNLQCPPDVLVRNVSVTDELRILSGLLSEQAEITI